MAMSKEVKTRLQDNFGHIIDNLSLDIQVSVDQYGGEPVIEVRVYDSNGAVIKSGDVDVVSHWFHGLEMGINWGYNAGLNYGDAGADSVPLTELDEYFN